MNNLPDCVLHWTYPWGRRRWWKPHHIPTPAFWVRNGVRNEKPQFPSGPPFRDNNGTVGIVSTSDSFRSKMLTICMKYSFKKQSSLGVSVLQPATWSPLHSLAFSSLFPSGFSFNSRFPHVPRRQTAVYCTLNQPLFAKQSGESVLCWFVPDMDNYLITWY